MALFPGALPVAGTASSSATLAAAGHTALHNTSYDEIRAIATKIGTGASTPTASTVLRGTGAGTSAWGQVILTTDVSGLLPVQNGGTNAATAADARASLGLYSTTEVDAAITAVKAALYPVGSIYTNAVNATNPATLLGFGTWSAFGTGRVLVGIDGTQTEFDTIGETGGAKTHTLTSAEMPSHTHVQNMATGANDGITTIAQSGSQSSASVDSSYSTDATGGGGAHNNLQPYITVYMWQRTA